MASKFRKLLSFKINSHSNDVVNSNEFRTNDVIKASHLDNFHKWDMPKSILKLFKKSVYLAFKLLF